MTVNEHWMYQGRQQHQWFGHGTAPKDAREAAEPSGSGELFDQANIGQRIDYAVSRVVAEAPRGERSRWENRLNGAARNSIKAVLGTWYGARSMSRDAFRQRLLAPYASDESVDQLRAAAKGVVEARTSNQLGEAGSALAAAIFKVGVDAWPRYLGDAERRAVTAASDRAIPGVMRASSDGMDMPRAIGTAIVLGGIILYLRHQQEEAARRAGPKPTSTPAPQRPTIMEATVPLPSPKEGETPADVLTPGGQNVGEPGENSGVRVLPGGENGARELFDRLTKGGTDITPNGHPGKVIRMPDGSVISLRPTSKSGPPTIDVNVPGLNIRKLKFPWESGR